MLGGCPAVGMTSSMLCLWLLCADGHCCRLQAAPAKTEPTAGGRSKRKKRKAKVSCHYGLLRPHLSAALLESSAGHHLQGGWGI